MKEKQLEGVLNKIRGLGYEIGNGFSKCDGCALEVECGALENAIDDLSEIADGLPNLKLMVISKVSPDTFCLRVIDKPDEAVGIYVMI